MAKVPDAPVPLANNRPNSFFASSPGAEQLTEVSVGEYEDGRYTSIAKARQVVNDQFMLLEKQSYRSAAGVQATMQTHILGHQKIAGWLNKSSYAGIAGVWYLRESNPVP